MATKKAIYQYDNGTGWDEIMFKTTADQVVESSSKMFVSDSEKSTWNSKANGNHTHNYAGSSSAGGSANTAVKLATVRTINGTSFDGSASITTSNWGTGRTLTIGNSGKTVNGSGNVSWSLSEIGAMAFDYSGEHSNYAHPRIFVPDKEWLRAPSGGLVPFKHKSGYLGIESKSWYDLHTVHINSKPIGGFDGRWWDIMPVVSPDGVVEVGRVIDFHDSNNHAGDFTYRLHADGGTLYHSGSLGQMSDRTLKENITYIDEKPGLLSKDRKDNSTPFKDFIKDFRFATFNYKEDVNKELNFGFIAQDITNSEVGKLMLRQYEKEDIDNKTSEVKSTTNVLSFDISSYITIVAKGLQEEIKSRDEEINYLKQELLKLKEKLGV